MNSKSVCSIGFFDGVHRGHRFLIQQVLDEAAKRSARSLLITFDRHPRSVFAPDSAPALITSGSEKMALLRATGVDDVFVLPFDRSMAALTAREFMDKVLKQQLGVTTLVIGYDHHFGRPQGERFDDYVCFGRELGIEVVRARELEGEHVSSSTIRKALLQGDVERAAQLLGRQYEWTGRVVHGHAIGRQLGFPTANLESVEPQKLLPARGVYAVKVKDCGINAMLNIGQRPTLDNGNDVSIEAHLLGFEGNLYDKELTIAFAARLRQEQKFGSEDALKEQLWLDKERAEAILKAEG